MYLFVYGLFCQGGLKFVLPTQHSFFEHLFNLYCWTSVVNMKQDLNFIVYDYKSVICISIKQNFIQYRCCNFRLGRLHLAFSKKRNICQMQRLEKNECLFGFYFWRQPSWRIFNYGECQIVGSPNLLMSVNGKILSIANYWHKPFDKRKRNFINIEDHLCS